MFRVYKDFHKRTSSLMDSQVIDPINNRMHARTGAHMSKRVHRLEINKIFGPPDSPKYVCVSEHDQPRAYAFKDVVEICDQIYDLISPSNTAGSVGGNPNAAPGSSSFQVGSLDISQYCQGPIYFACPIGVVVKKFRLPTPIWERAIKDAFCPCQ